MDDYFSFVKRNLKISNSIAVIVGSLQVEADENQFSNYNQAFFKSIDTEKEKVSGILVIYKQAFIHYLETSSIVLDLYLRDLSSTTLTINLRLLLADQRERRFSTFWGSKIIFNTTDSSPLTYGSLDDASLDEQLALVCTSLISIVSNLSSLDQVSLF